MPEQLIEIDCLIEARWLLPMAEGVGLLERHSVGIKNEKIVDVLPAEKAKALYSAAQYVLLDEHILIPGLINLHTHAAMTLMRGLADDLPLMQWLKEHIWPAEAEVVSPKFVRDGTLLACAEMLAGGVTTFNDMYFYPDSAAQAATQTGMRANLGLVVLDFPSAYANDTDDYILKGLEARDGWRDNALISSSMAPHAPYTVSNASFEKVVTYAEQLGIGIHTHLHETDDEIKQSISQYGIRPLQRLAELGVLSPGTIAAHCVHFDQQDIDIFAAHGCHVAHCPSSNLKLASGFAPVDSFIQNGLNVAIGTDGAASNNRLDMFAELRLAALLSKGVSGNAASMPAIKAMQMATIDAAKALGMESKIGSIESGKQADMSAVKLSSLQNQPCFDPVSQLVYTASREDVTHVWVAGEIRYQNGVYAGVEPAELKEITNLWQSKLAQFK